MAIQFQNDYQLLELESGANWDIASTHYRRLVHKWHPDRFVQRPRERVHAQQKFIELTKAFNNLRTFYRENDRLPFQQIKKSDAPAPEPTAEQRVSPASNADIEASFLNKRKPSTKTANWSKLKPLFWVIPTGAVITAALFTFYIFDRNAKLDTMEEASRVLRSAKPSEYTQNTSAIHQSNRRSSLLNEASNKNLGSKLAKDVF